MTDSEKIDRALRGEYIFGVAPLLAAEVARLRASCEFALEAIGRQTKFYRDPILARVVLDLEAALSGEPRKET